jgi:hypothetical protein
VQPAYWPSGQEGGYELDWKELWPRKNERDSKGAWDGFKDICEEFKERMKNDFSQFPVGTR